MIEAVIWDFGGVLTTSPFEAFSRYETERGLPADIIRRTNAANQSELSLSFDAELTAGAGGIDWVLRVAGDQTAALQTFYTNGLLKLDSLPDGEVFSSTNNI